ncbi:hypothetical protein Ddye_004204 [Dipteronia dyeriana]|uniref:RRM domain-containing protein n=1 Tax=Dipteronia dyeriana TaxID=168575 RepID=A0AAD9XUG9_9ROSI|nr:hypothetical protein Ddye_004204 [Dipteronia dyeriana]
MSDLEERERAAFAPDPSVKAREEEERKLKEYVQQCLQTRNRLAQSLLRDTKQSGGERRETKQIGGCGAGLDKDKVLKVSWEKVGEDYTAERLRELFSEFGVVSDVDIKSFKKKGSALVVMATKDAAVAATGSVCGSLSNPRLVLPIQLAVATEFPSAQRSAETNHINNLVGPSYQACEDSVLQKIPMAAKRKK